MVSLRHQDGISHSQLAEEIGITPATVSNTIKRMEKAGFVVRRRDAEDERVSQVYLTDLGRSIISKVETSLQQMNDIVITGFSEDEQSTLCNYLDRILENLVVTN